MIVQWLGCPRSFVHPAAKFRKTSSFFFFGVLLLVKSSRLTWLGSCFVQRHHCLHQPPYTSLPPAWWCGHAGSFPVEVVTWLHKREGEGGVKINEKNTTCVHATCCCACLSAERAANQLQAQAMWCYVKFLWVARCPSLTWFHSRFSLFPASLPSIQTLEGTRGQVVSLRISIGVND